jgi:hypothetical protein
MMPDSQDDGIALWLKKLAGLELQDNGWNCFLPTVPQRFEN